MGAAGRAPGAGGLLRERGARGGDLGETRPQIRVGHTGEVVEIGQVDTVDRAGGGVEVAGDAEVDQQQGAAVPAAGMRAQRRGVEQGALDRGTADDDVVRMGLRQSVGQRQAGTAELRGEEARILEGARGDGDVAGAALLTPFAGYAPSTRRAMTLAFVAVQQARAAREGAGSRAEGLTAAFAAARGRV